MGLRRLADVTGDDEPSVGGKAAALGELTAAGLPVPPGFVVSAETYRSFLVGAEIDGDLDAALDVDAEDPAALAEAATLAQALVRNASVPADVQGDILAAYDELAGEAAAGDRSDGDHADRALDGPPVAVRSSATAEDQPDASFAGQQETILNVDRQSLIAAVKECWASLFTERAIAYRQRQGYPASEVDVAVIVQLLVDADASGVLFTRHPATGAHATVVEAAWGLGEAVVSGEVSPDRYVLDPDDGTAEEVQIGDKRRRYVRDPENGTTAVEPVPDEYRERRVLDGDALARLHALADRVETLYELPQDVEWALVEHGGDDPPVAGTDPSDGLDGRTFYLLQSRPITTIDEASEEKDDVEQAPADTAAAPEPQDAQSTDWNGAASAPDGGSQALATGEPLVTGLGASPGVATGCARIVETLDELDRVEEGDVIVTEMTTPDMVPAMQRAVGIVTDEGGLTSHASIVSRELRVPAVVGTGDATAAIQDGQRVRLDGETGRVVDTDAIDADSIEEAAEDSPPTPGADQGSDGRQGTRPRPADTAPPATATEVKVNVSMPGAAERAAATGADGVGLLRIEHIVLATGETPEHMITHEGRDAFVDVVADGIQPVAEAFYPQPVRVRTLDAPTDEFRSLEGGADEPEEANPMLGHRGIRRSLASPGPFRAQLAAIAKCHELGYDNVELMLPLVTDAKDVRAALEHMEAEGLDPRTIDWGVMIETPASARCIEALCETGIDFASFGTNDLTQYTLAVDRNNERVADRFDECHPAVLSLIDDVIDTCRERDVRTSICGQAGSNLEMVRHLVGAGITSISANVDAVADVQREVERVEQRLVLESVRADRP